VIYPLIVDGHGRWPECLDRIWGQLEQRLGKSTGTREMITLVRVGTVSGWARLIAAVEEALRLGVTDAAAVLHILNMPDPEERRPHAIALAEERAEFERPMPVRDEYDLLLNDTPGSGRFISSRSIVRVHFVSSSYRRSTAEAKRGFSGSETAGPFHKFAGAPAPFRARRSFPLIVEQFGLLRRGQLRKERGDFGTQRCRHGLGSHVVEQRLEGNRFGGAPLLFDHLGQGILWFFDRFVESGERSQEDWRNGLRGRSQEFFHCGDDFGAVLARTKPVLQDLSGLNISYAKPAHHFANRGRRVEISEAASGVHARFADTAHQFPPGRGLQAFF
jgi:hypothetical protein